MMFAESENNTKLGKVERVDMGRLIDETIDSIKTPESQNKKLKELTACTLELRNSIRIAGIKPGIENAIVDQVNDVKFMQERLVALVQKERKKIIERIRAIQKHWDEHLENNLHELNLKLKESEAKHQLEVQRLKSKFKNLRNSQKLELQTLKSEHENALVKMDKQKKLAIQQLKRKTELIVDRLVDKEKQDLLQATIQQHQNEMHQVEMRWKQKLTRLEEKHEEILNEKTRKQNSLNDLNSQNQIKQAKKEIKDLNALLEEMEASNSKLSMQLQTSELKHRKEMNNQMTVHQNQIAVINKENKQQLDEIHDRIRTVIDKKTLTINNLKNQITVLEDRAMVAEEALQQLDAGLSAVR